MEESEALLLPLSAAVIGLYLDYVSAVIRYQGDTVLFVTADLLEDRL
jgi:hypothetical protein